MRVSGAKVSQRIKVDFFENKKDLGENLDQAKQRVSGQDKIKLIKDSRYISLVEVVEDVSSEGSDPFASDKESEDDQKSLENGINNAFNVRPLNQAQDDVKKKEARSNFVQLRSAMMDEGDASWTLRPKDAKSPPKLAPIPSKFNFQSMGD